MRPVPWAARTITSVGKIVLVALVSRVSAVTPVPVIPVCTDQQLQAFALRSDEANGHRRFTLPKITYPFGTKLPFRWGWGLEITVRVDEGGHAVCYGKRNQFAQPLQLNHERRAVLAVLSSWNYSPFVKNGKPVPVVLREYIREEEAPGRHRDLPSVPLAKTHIALERTNCYGTCPTYRVDLFGDGTAVYEGGIYVDVTGRHSYHVAPAEIAKLVASAKSKDLWSLRSRYVSEVTDNPTSIVTIELGKEVLKVTDYVGQDVGMPEHVIEFEKEVDEVAQAHQWIHIGSQAIDYLRADHFPFSSHEGGEVLLRAIADKDQKDNQAILQLMELGAPWSIQLDSNETFRDARGSALTFALANQRVPVVNVLLEQGALRERGIVDQKKLDGAFRAAIQGGRLELVQEIWDAGGTLHPSLTYDDVSADPKPITKRAPVTLLLSHPPYKTEPWDGLEITKWLIAKGCDIHAHGADGRTILHIAAEAGDAKMVRYVLDQGVSASTPGAFALPALGYTQNEDVVLMLLKAGTDLSKMDDGGKWLRQAAVSNHWVGVAGWLDAHKN